MADIDKALDQCETIIELIDNEVPDHAWDTSPDFFESIREKVNSMSEWIEENEHITPRMQKSLDGMEQGVRKWIKE